MSVIPLMYPELSAETRYIIQFFARSEVRSYAVYHENTVERIAQTDGGIEIDRR